MWITVGLLLAMPVEAQEPDGHPIDRWLVSPALSTADAGQAVERLTGHPPVFPDRDAEVAGVHWTLERAAADAPGAASVRLPRAAPGARRLLHSYLRTDGDRTAILAWRAGDCERVALWLNGQSITPLDAAGGPAEASAGDGPAEASAGDGPAEASAGDGHAGETPIRLATGWNSLLISVRSGDCPSELAAWLSSAQRVESGAADPADIRIQASRPPGIHRNHPAAWVTIGEEVRPGPLSWPAETRELVAVLALTVVSWGRDPADPLPELPELLPEDEEAEAPPRGRIRVRDAPPEEADPEVPAEDDEAPEEVRDEEPEEEPEEDLPPAERVEASWAEIRARLAPPPTPRAPAASTVLVEGRAGGARIRTPVETPVPGEPVRFAVPLTFRELQRATAAEGVSLDVRWARERWRGARSVDARAVEERLREPIPLTGWIAAAEPDRRAEPTPELPRAAGEVRSGRWQVPAALAGQRVELLTDGAPGRYRVDGRALMAADAGPEGREARGSRARIPLCDPCREGATLVIQVEATGEWTEPPRAVTEGTAGRE